MTAARILTVRQPWAWAIIHGGKNVENRVRNIAGDYRGPVLIHAAKVVDEEADANIGGDRRFCKLSTALCATNKWRREPAEPYYARGAIIGVVDLVAVHRAEGTDQGITADYIRETNPFALNGPCSPWAEANAHHLVFENPRALDEPIPYRGALGLRKTDLFISGDEWLGQYVTPGPKHGMCSPYGCPPSCYSEPVGRLVATS